MSEKNRLQSRLVIIAALTASFMMFVFGIAHRTLTARLANPEGVSSMSPDALEKIPMQINQWTGEEKPLDAVIIEATDTDAHVSRRYYRSNGSEQILLYIAAGKRARDLMPHRPEVCYTGSGWTRVASSSMELLLDDGMSLPCNVFQFKKGVLNTNKIIILDYYIVDGQFCRDISLLRSKIWRGSGAVKYVAQVQIIAEIKVNNTEEPAMKMISDFARESAVSIMQVLEGVTNSEKGDTRRLSTDYTSGDSNIGRQPD
jgi:EpsI family protein